MRHTLETVLGTLSWETNGSGMEVTLGRREISVLWSEVTAAGLVESAMSLSRTPDLPKVFSEMSSILPGLGKLTEINEHMAANYRTLALARGPSDSRTIRIPFPLGDEETALLVDEVREHVADRWLGEIALGESYQRLGIRRPWWTIPVTILFTGTLGLVMLFACGGFGALSEGSFDIPGAAWLGMALWLLLIGGLVLVYRRLWWR